jgi:topoisomerase-4 subunit A
VLKKNFTELSKTYGPETLLGRRRTDVGETPVEIDLEEAIPVEIVPVTVVCSDKGWVRCLKGHVALDEIKYKEGDEARFAFHCQSHEKILIFSNTGRAFTLSSDKLPSGRSQGDALRHVVDLPPQDEVVQVMALPVTEADVLLISHKGRGFRIKTTQLVAQTRQGKQIFNCGEGDYVRFCWLQTKSHVAMIGTHRKLLIQNVDDIPYFARGGGVTLQKYKEAVLADAMLMNLEDGLAFRRGLQMTLEKTLLPWTGKRGSIGKLAPLGFPRSNKFSG